MPAADIVKIRLNSVGNPEYRSFPGSTDEVPLSPENVRVGFSVDVEINRPESLVKVKVTMGYLDGQKTIFDGTLESVYEVQELASFITEEEGGKFHLESNFLPMLINMSFGTTRGYFVAALSKTVLQKYPFPMIDTESVLKRTSYQLV